MGVANALAVVITFCACQHAVAAPPSESWHQPEGGRTKVLYVLECEGPAEWQAVPVDEPVVNWIRELKDRLTAHIERPDGEDLTVRFQRNPLHTQTHKRSRRYNQSLLLNRTIRHTVLHATHFALLNLISVV